MNAKILAVALSAAAILSAPSAALASKRDNARTSIAAAEAKVGMNDKTPMGGQAAEIQARAHAALDRAHDAWGRSKEDAAIAAATEADSLADLAAATQQKQSARAEARATENALPPPAPDAGPPPPAPQR
jgi:hypothetical protein